MSNGQLFHGRLLRAAVFLALTTSLAVAQTPITVPKNKYTPAQDVELGQQAAKEVEQQLPLLRDDTIESFVDRIGRRLVQVMPPETEHREFRYSFKVINVREINAFALPGGPMYINRGMIQAARVEGEAAGVMAHELSHVILRHGTAGATKAQPFEIGGGLGAAGSAATALESASATQQVERRCCSTAIRCTLRNDRGARCGLTQVNSQPRHLALERVDAFADAAVACCSRPESTVQTDPVPGWRCRLRHDVPR